MHTYERRWTDDSPMPDIETYRFADALDVVVLAEVDRLIGWKTWPEVWHLDHEGRFRCYFKASSGDSLQRWADDPSDLHRSRMEGLRQGGCPDGWLIVDARPTACIRNPVDDTDAAAFLTVRKHLRSMGLTLVDTVVFDDQCQWWSMREQTSGTARWSDAGESPPDLPASSW